MSVLKESAHDSEVMKVHISTCIIYTKNCTKYQNTCWDIRILEQWSKTNDRPVSFSEAVYKGIRNQLLDYIHDDTIRCWY
jgi:hypothetical protein